MIGRRRTDRRGPPRSARLTAALGALLLGALLLGALVPGCSRPAPPRRAVVVLLDAARADRFSCYGYERATTPEMDRIAERGHVFEKHFSTGVNTRESMPTFLYSRYYVKPVFPYSRSVALYSPEDLFRVLDDEAISFPAALAADGMRTAAVSSHHWFHEDTDFAKEFQEFHDLASAVSRKSKQVYPTADVVVDEALRWLGDVGEDEEFLLYVHLMDTHFPHAFDEDARAFFGAPEYSSERFAPTGEAIGHGALEGEDREYMDALYDGDLRFADREIGRLIDHLEEREWLDDTLFAITSDHAEKLWHFDGRFLHGGEWTDEVSHVPMIVSWPDRVPRGRTTHPTQGADVHPTLLSLLDVELPEGKSVVGLDMFDAAVAQRPWIYSRAGARSRDCKLLLAIEDSHLDEFFFDDGFAAGVRARLFDLRADPHELRDVSRDHPELVASLVADFRRTQKPLFERYQRAVADVQPRGSFAIEARDWDSEGGFPHIQEFTELGDAERLLAESPNGWIRSDLWGDIWFRARPDAAPLEIRTTVPSGEYEITLHANGWCDVEIGGRIESVRTDPAPEDWSGRWYQPSLGTVRVTERTFRMVVHPLSDRGTPLRLRRIGFRPTGAKVSLDGEDRTAALRALGYAE